GVHGLFSECRDCLHLPRGRPFEASSHDGRAVGASCGQTELPATDSPFPRLHPPNAPSIPPPSPVVQSLSTQRTVELARSGFRRFCKQGGYLLAGSGCQALMSPIKSSLPRTRPRSQTVGCKNEGKLNVGLGFSALFAEP